LEISSPRLRRRATSSAPCDRPSPTRVFQGMDGRSWPKFAVRELRISTLWGVREQRDSTRVFEVRTAAGAAIGRAKSSHRNAAASSAIQRTFAAPGANHIDDANTGCGEQVIDVPTQRLFLAEMACDAGLDMALRRTGVHVPSSRKIECTQAADDAPQSLRHFDQQLITDFPRHRGSIERGVLPKRSNRPKLGLHEGDLG